jgi:hypothetical protein
MQSGIIIPPTEVVRYWHPRKGGWYHARLIREGRKWATIKEFGSGRQRRMLVGEIEHT